VEKPIPPGTVLDQDDRLFFGNCQIPNLFESDAVDVVEPADVLQLSLKRRDGKRVPCSTPGIRGRQGNEMEKEHQACGNRCNETCIPNCPTLQSRTPYISPDQTKCGNRKQSVARGCHMNQSLSDKPRHKPEQQKG